MNITRTCHIRHQKIIANHAVVFHEPDGDLNQFLEGAYDHFKINYPRFYKMDRLSKIGFLAAEILLSEQPSFNQYSPDQKNLILANANASLDTDLRYAESSKAVSSPGLFVYTLPNIVAGEICIRHNIKGESSFFISENFDTSFMEAYVSSVMLQVGNNDQPKSCVAGWIDVLGEQHDVFLYLVENVRQGIKHSAAQLKDLYQTELWTH